MTVGMFARAHEALEHHLKTCRSCRLDAAGGCTDGDRLHRLVADEVDERETTTFATAGPLSVLDGMEAT